MIHTLGGSKILAAAEPDVLVKQLATDETIAAADTRLS